MISVLQPGRVLLDPLEAVAEAVRARRWVMPLAMLVCGVCFSSAAFALRWDATPSVTQSLAQSGALASASEREVAEKVQVAQRVKLVTGIAWGVTVQPLLVLLLAMVLKLAGWLVGRSAPLAAAFTAAAVAMLPLALFHLLLGAALLRQPGVTESQLVTLLPSNLAALEPSTGPVASRLMRAVDLFSVWSVGLLGLGLAAATGMKRRWATLLSVLLYAMYVGVFVVGIPGLTGAGR